LIKRIFNEKIAIFSLIPLVFFPLLWLIQTNILHESLDLGLFLSALLFFDFFLEKRKLCWWGLAVLFLSLAVLDFVGILLWSIVFLGLAFLRSKKNNLRKNIIWGFLTIFLSLILSFVILFLLLFLTREVEPVARLKVIFFGFGTTGVFSGWGLMNILRMLRNSLYALFYGYSIGAILGLLFTGFYLFRKRKYSLFIFLFSFFVPFLITGKFWHFGPFGRLSGLMAYPLALFLALMPWRKIYWVLIAVIFLTFCPTFWVYQKIPVSQIQASLINSLKMGEKDILVISDYQRPQLDYDNALYVNSNEEIHKMVIGKITESLLSGKRVFISQQAIDAPYWQYDGQQIHVVSKGNKDKAQLKEFLKDKKIKPVAVEKNFPLLTIYQLSLQTE
jgi:hypothetical protein